MYNNPGLVYLGPWPSLVNLTIVRWDGAIRLLRLGSMFTKFGVNLMMDPLVNIDDYCICPIQSTLRFSERIESNRSSTG